MKEIENNKVVLEIGDFEKMVEGVFFAMEKINPRYYIKIMIKVVSGNSITTKEYRNFINILQDEDFLDLLKDYSDSLGISDILQTLDIKNLISLVKDKTTKSLITTLELEGDIGYRFQMRRQVGSEFKVENYIVGLDSKANRVIYEILHVKNDWGNNLRCGLKDKNRNIIKRGYLDENGKNIYGGVNRFWISIKLTKKDGKQYLRVRKTQDGPIEMVDIDGNKIDSD